MQDNLLKNMSLIEPISKKKQRQIDAFLASPLRIDETIIIRDQDGKRVPYTLKGVTDSAMVLLRRDYSTVDEFPLSTEIERTFRHIGANPFDKRLDHARAIQFSLDSIIHTLDLLGEKEAEGSEYDIDGVRIMSCNWDPYIYDKDGGKQRYQRPLVWRLSQKQALISSIYNGIDCGKVMVRERSYTMLEAMRNKGEKELSFHDIVDGKQRLQTIRGFILGEFKDAYGNKYSDLSNEAQGRFLSHQLISYYSLPDITTDEETLRQFLKLNFSGIPQSKAHMKYVDSLYRKIQ